MRKWTPQSPKKRPISGSTEEATYIWIESDQCIRCGNCYNVCPVDAITLRKADRCNSNC
ncbi:MAG: 4Fe-4S binding protein [Planctomycetota bacterium]